MPRKSKRPGKAAQRKRAVRRVAAPLRTVPLEIVEHLTAAQAARIVGITTSAIKQARLRGALGSVKFGPRMYLYHRAEVERFRDDPARKAGWPKGRPRR